MFLIVSRIFWALFSPSKLLVFLALGGVGVLFTRFARSGRYALSGVMGVYVLCGFGPVGVILVRPLENRFPLPPLTAAPPAGIIVLGGALRPQMTDARGSPALSEGGGRMTAAAVLGLRYPSALIVFSGGPDDPVMPERDEAHAARRFLMSLGIAADRIALENRSRNTDQNAAFTQQLVHPRPDQKWLLVTSAAHMPRAVGAFRRAGFAVVAYPTDYLTLGLPSDFWTFREDSLEGLAIMNIAVHEWLGLVVYRLTDKADGFLPGP